MTTLTYQIREFVKGDAKVFEVWHSRETKRNFIRTEYVWERLAESPTFKEAEAFVSEKAGGYYGSIHDYDQNGRSITYLP